MKIAVDGGCRHINDGFLGSQRQSLFVLIEGDDLIVGEILPYCPGDGAADEAHADKSNLMLHDDSPHFLNDALGNIVYSNS